MAHRTGNELMHDPCNLYNGLEKRLECDSLAAIVAQGCADSETIEASPCAKEAYELGLLLR